MNYYAHTVKDEDGSACPEKDWEPLFTPFGQIDEHAPEKACAGFMGEHDPTREECLHCVNKDPKHGHLNKVAYWTAKFSADTLPLNSSDRTLMARWGYLTGLWHDLGKYQEKFQERLRGSACKVEHTGAGAVLAKNLFGKKLFLPISLTIAGHHAGLANLQEVSGGLSKLTTLTNRLRKNSPLSLHWSDDDKAQLTSLNLPGEFPLFSDGVSERFSVTLLTRTLFSCLTDADSLVTEAIYKQRQFNYTSIEKLSVKLDQLLDGINPEADPSKKKINHLRAEILEKCRFSAGKPAGIFSLNVPTGGGKTLSSLSFALRHCVKHDLERVIIIAPYTTIIEQTASECRKFLGSKNILEHHSNIEEHLDQEKEGLESNRLLKLAAENWDAPVIVTTTVQFFESLFTHKRSAGRKVHNITRSVIILDEAHCIPKKVLDPCLNALKALSSQQGCSVVLSTATQPNFIKAEGFLDGFDNVESIISAEYAKHLHQELTQKRSVLHWHHEPLDSSKKIYDLFKASKRKQKLMILNKKEQVAQVYNEAKEDHENVFHLSTNLCAVHRREQFSKIKDLLEKQEEVSVFATNLIECGIDHSYAAVFRSLAGMDSLAQSMGRCNRSGEYPEKGEFTVFTVDESLMGDLKARKQATQQLLDQSGTPEHLADMELYKQYFEKVLYSAEGDRLSRDLERVMDHLERREIEEASHRFNLIDNHTPYTIVVPWGDKGKGLLKNVLDKLKEYKPLNKQDLRSLQPYTLKLSEYEFQKANDYLAPLFNDDYSYYIPPEEESFKNAYDNQLGLRIYENNLRDLQAC